MVSYLLLKRYHLVITVFIDDARLWDALRRAYLVEQNKGKEGEEDMQNRFNLDTPIDDEGGNLSVGQVSQCFTEIELSNDFVSFSAESCFSSKSLGQGFEDPNP